MKRLFTWLHISDLHAGIEEQGWLWPNLKHLIIDDLKKVVEKSGPWDVVIFSGDIAQAGSAQDFEAATSALRELWAAFKSIGFSPKLLVVSGKWRTAESARNGEGDCQTRQVIRCLFTGSRHNPGNQR